MNPFNNPMIVADGVSRECLQEAFDRYLAPGGFKDYGPNGLQVEGKPRIRRLVSGVTASLALIEAAIEARADALFVHHGLFWRGQDGRVRGWMKQRLSRLLAHDINLYAYHLPLDAHPVWGNNAQLAQRLGVVPSAQAGFGRFGDQMLGVMGHCEPTTAQAFAKRAEAVLEREVLLVGPMQRSVRQVALCSGGAQSYFEAAMEVGADLFVTGEISEPQAHLASECGVAYIACGHHASERYGAPALAQQVANELGLEHQFIDIPNPA